MPSTHFLSLQFRRQIWYSLDNSLDDSAIFAAERLVALSSPSDPDLDNIHLLALAHFRANNLRIAMHLCENKKHIGCAYVYALCCLKLGKYRLGCRALERMRSSWPKTCHIYSHNDGERQALPDMAAVQSLLGHLYRNFGDAKEAMECYSTALSINPFLWDAFDGLCKLGVNLKINNIYGVTPAMIAARSTWLDNADSSVGIENSQNQDPFVSSSASSSSSDDNSHSHHQPFLFRAAENAVLFSQSKNLDTPTAGSFTSADHDGDIQMSARSTSASTPSDPSRGARSRSSRAPPDAPRRTSSSSAGVERRSSRLSAPQSRQPPTLSTTTATAQPQHQLSGSVRGRLRSGLLKSKSVPAPSSGAASGDEANEAPVKVVPDDGERIEAEATMLSLYETVAVGMHALSRFDLSIPPPEQQDSPYILSKIGRAYFEIVRYKEAEAAFVRLREVDPFRLDDMEIYSTLLWHLRKDVELAFLAHELVDIDRNSPQTWIAIGNSFSLQKEHDQALKCFRRASHLDPTFAYPYTLQGHEHVANEEYESAQSAFRLAMRAEWRHYNAWYGIGMLFLKTGKFDLAEQHFRQAALINPGNAVLICCIGMVLEKLNRLDEALAQYDVACGLQPTSAMPRFKKARLLMSMRKYDACLAELRVVKNLAPDESSVHYLLGRLYKAQGDKQSAIRHFTAALNLDPKASHVIKEAIEGLENDSE
ncbi:hypothetical protein BZA70DRAFT_285402 [Myxozyma melibiosi]|uniref:Uncharacterized protein n=1 Tax=Myxozyma melibiosi TaxID=54550 RepID=A0ABR1EYA0_9ASCO